MGISYVGFGFMLPIKRATALRYTIGKKHKGKSVPAEVLPNELKMGNVAINVYVAEHCPTCPHESS